MRSIGRTFIIIGLLSLVPCSASAADPVSEPLIVALFDTGLDERHPYFSNRLWGNSDESSHADKDDTIAGFEGHGTHVAGIILGRHQSASYSDRLPIQLMMFTYDPINPGKSLFESLEQAEQHNVKLFNISFTQKRFPLLSIEEVKQITEEQRLDLIPRMEAFFPNNNPIESDQDFEETYIEYQREYWEWWDRALQKIGELENQMLFIVSAGDERLALNDVTVEPVNQSGDHIISVLQLDSTYRPTMQANTGNEIVSVGAIGENVTSTAPTWMELSTPGIMEMSGSSQSAAKITYECAKIMLANEESPYSPLQLKDKLMQQLSQPSKALKAYTKTGKYLLED